MAVYIITGASTGVGRACAERFAREGHTVWAMARGRDKLEALAEQYEGGIDPLPCDVGDLAAVKGAFSIIAANTPKVDVLINNAGVTGAGGWDIDEIDRIVDTNLKGTMYCTYAVLPLMRATGGGNIINVASIAGYDIAQQGTNGLYTATKHGMVAFSDAIGRKLKGENILVTALCPGGIDTPLWNDEHPYPFGRDQMIRPEEVAELIEYVLQQPRRTQFKNVVFIPTCESW